MPLFAIWDDLYDDYYETNHAVPQFSNEKQAESYLENLKKEVADREAAEWLKVEHAKFLADKDEPEPSDEELDELPISAVMDGGVQTFPDAAALDEALNAAPAGNFRITDDHLGEGGAKQKYARNIEASELCFVWRRSTGVPPPRNSRCFHSMWAGAVWQTLLTPAKIVGQRNTPN